MCAHTARLLNKLPVTEVAVSDENFGQQMHWQPNKISNALLMKRIVDKSRSGSEPNILA